MDPMTIIFLASEVISLLMGSLSAIGDSNAATKTNQAIEKLADLREKISAKQISASNAVSRLQSYMNGLQSILPFVDSRLNLQGKLAQIQNQIDDINDDQVQLGALSAKVDSQSVSNPGGLAGLGATSGNFSSIESEFDKGVGSVDYDSIAKNDSGNNSNNKYIK